RVREALMRLEVAADTYLSVATPVQLAADWLLRRGQVVREQIHRRVTSNYEALRETAATAPWCQVLRAEGGWSAVLRIPHTMPEDKRVIHLLEHEGVLVHPGFFFDFPREGYLVVSLLAHPDVFRPALERL